MQYGDKISDKKCARCGKPIGTVNITYRDDLWFHIDCVKQGEIELQRANEIAARYGFPPAK